MSDTYGTCECGFTAEDFESARVHVRDHHGGAQRVAPYFETEEADS